MISVAGVSASRKTPGINFNVILGGPGTSAGAATKRIVLLGNMLATALTNSSPTFSVAAGTATPEEVVFVASESDAKALFGQGSELHRMAARVFEQYPDAAVYACPVAQVSGTKASGVLTFATSAGAAFTVRLKLCGQVIDVGIASGDTATAIAAAVADAINDAADLPFTAQNSSGVVTVTAKHDGPRGNWLIVDAYFVPNGSTIETRITTSSTTSPGASTTGIWSSTGALGGEITLTSGATQDSFANALTAIDPQKWDRIVGACVEATNIGRILTQVDNDAGPTVQQREQVVVGTSDTLANATTLATGRNSSRCQVVWHHASPIPPWECAAQVCAGRLAGDASAGGVLVGEASDCAANLDGLELATLVSQRVVADQPTATEIESALNNGLAVLAPSGARPGRVALVRSITSRSLASGVPNYAVIDTAYVCQVDDCADDLQSYLTSLLRGAKLGADGADGNPAARVANVTTPSIIRSAISARLKYREANGWMRDVDANASLLVVEADPVVSGRVNCEIPCEPITGLHNVAGNVRQLASL